ncbi:MULTISPECIES: AI-2E family transporter [Streptomyces]|uniref:Putative integral membrane protein n=4 Tax=Streptomyces venezuelae TaxID=54571 RepID=F2R192_STRVP|nr:AI-2E family transporter [Streptomyces venezuelae]APE23645.1 AI-2E family transporter [Streptomyces venezuelae]QES01019.1 AI-2E family transporter [Streptomyces venezuelae ATCC 10712]CCA57983.1 putative integral membrane protein [Streptomyces venezuelae ATCC 10712]
MSRVPGWLGRLGESLSRMGERLDERRAEAEREGDPLRPAHEPGERPAAGEATTAPAAPAVDPDTAAPLPATAGGEPGRSVPAPPSYAPAVAARPDPVAAIPWGMRVAAEASWRLLVFAGTVWVLMKVISSVQLVVLAFVAALLVTALLQPTVALLRRKGLPRGLATAVTAVSGFVVMGLVGWFVVWQVMDNIDTLSDRVKDGIEELKRWLLDSPFHVTEQQINDIAKNLSDTIGANAEQITSAGLQGVTVVVEAMTGILLAMFSTLFLLYDGKKVWEWTLKLVPAQARPGVAGAGPRAWRTLTAYVRGTVLVALIDAVFIGLGLWFLEVPMAVPLAVFIFLFAFIPLVGAVVSGALAVVVALVTNGVFTALMVLVVVLAVQQIEGHVLQPFILGRAVRVHPLAVVLAVAAGGLTAGIGGAVVAVPLVAVLNTVVGYLRAYSTEQALRSAPEPRGATAYEVAPTPAPGSAGGASDGKGDVT